MKLAFQKNIQNLSGLFLLLMTVGLFATACNKETEEPQNVLNEEEIVAVVEGALLADTDGLAAQSEDAVYIAEQYTVKDAQGGGPCGETKEFNGKLQLLQPADYRVVQRYLRLDAELQQCFHPTVSPLRPNGSREL